MAAVKGEWRLKRTWYTHEMWLVRLVRPIVRGLLYLLMKPDFEGFENLPAQGPCILACNHISLWDVLVMGAFLPRHPYFMAKQELFKYPILGWLIRLAGTFPVYRGGRDEWALEQAARVLDAGQVLFIFPEGTRSGPQAQLARGKVGAVKLALDYQVPLAPAAILGTQDIRPWPGRRSKVTLRIAPPMDVAALAGPPPHERRALRDLTRQMMQQIAAMLPPEHRGKYG